MIIIIIIIIIIYIFFYIVSYSVKIWNFKCEVKPWLKPFDDSPKCIKKLFDKYQILSSKTNNFLFSNTTLSFVIS